MGKRVLSSTSKLPFNLGGFPAVANEKAFYFDAAGVLQTEDRLINKSFTVGVSAGTPGDLAVSFSSQACKYDKIGDYVKLSMVFVFTPTYTTASGNFILTGLPFSADVNSALSMIPWVSGSNFTWPNTSTNLFLAAQSGATTALLQGNKSGNSVATAPITTFTSGSPYTMRFRGEYRVASV